MSKIVKNNTASPILINDVGVTIPASGQYTIPPIDYLLWAGSGDIIVEIGNSNVTVNDGSNDLGISDGTDLIKGLFPNPIGIQGSDGTQIGNTGDRLKTETEIVLQENFPVTFPEYEDILYRIRTTQPRQLFQAQWGFNGQPLAWSNQITGGATLLQPQDTGHNFIQFQTTSASGDKVVYQTKRYFRYQPSRNHSLTFACGFNDIKANCVKKVGQFDDDPTEGQNGFYIQQDGTGLKFVIAATSSGSQTYTTISRGNWNVDNLDGNGPSGLNYTDFELGNAAVWNIDYSWYGASVVQFNIVIGSTRIVLHEETFSLLNRTFPFTKTAFLPLRVEMENTGTVSGGGFITIGSISYDIENGEANEFGFQFAAANGVNGRSVNSNTNPTYLLALRPKATVNGIVNRGVLVPNNVNVLSSNDLFIEVLVGGVATGGTWVDNGVNSIAEYNVTATGYTGGRVVLSDYISTGGGRGSGALATSFPGDLFAAIDSLLGNQEAIVIRARKISNNGTAYASLSYKEVY